MRYGRVGSTWEEKQRGSGIRSAVIRNTDNPTWNLGFTIPVKQGITNLEMQVRVYDKDWITKDDLLGEVVVKVAGAMNKGRVDHNLDTQGNVAMTVGTRDVLQSTPSKNAFESLASIGKVERVHVDSITGDGPIILGTSPLPTALQGIFWLTAQKGA